MTEERRLWSYNKIIIIGQSIMIPLVLIGSALICILNVYAGIFMVYCSLSDGWQRGKAKAAAGQQK